MSSGMIMNIKNHLGNRPNFRDRSNLLRVLSREEILARYRTVWDQAMWEQVEAHATLESELADQLLASTPDNRWQLFSNAYRRLYSELPWLNKTIAIPNYKAFFSWGVLVGRNKKILEIGSGPGHLIRYLAGLGNECFATEITKERGASLGPDSKGVVWEQTDGVNLSNFFPENTFDYVLSDQVFEHLHPDDHIIHLAEARKVLKPGGQYILRTPHRSYGPSDLSWAFGLEQAVFLHLFEPDYISMTHLMRDAGYAKLSAVLAYGRFRLAVRSSLLLSYQVLIDQLETILVKSHAQRLAFRKYGKIFLVHPCVWIVGEK
jgi:SAM-dependent methyltransferase